MRQNNFLLLLFFFTYSLSSRAQCDDFAMTIVYSNPTCHNYNDGDIDLTITGGASPYHITISDYSGVIWGMDKKSQILAGDMWYFIYVTDENGCELYDSVYLVNPPLMVAMMTVTDPSYTGACDGMAVVDTVLNYQGDYTQISYFWIPGGPSGLGQNLKTDLCEANYSLVINDGFGCSIQNVLAIGSVSVEESLPNNPIHIFPNPTSDFVQIESHDFMSEITLFDISGRLVLSISSIQSTREVVDISHLPSGTYWIYVRKINGTFSSQLIKK